MIGEADNGPTSCGRLGMKSGVPYDWAKKLAEEWWCKEEEWCRKGDGEAALDATCIKTEFHEHLPWVEAHQGKSVAARAVLQHRAAVMEALVGVRVAQRIRGERRFEDRDMRRDAHTYYRSALSYRCTSC